MVVNYDNTVRDSDGSVVQFQYGGDCLDVCKSIYLSPSQFDFLHANKKSILDPKALEMAKAHLRDPDGLAKAKSKVKKHKEKREKKKKAKSRDSGFLRFCKKNPVKTEFNKDEPVKVGVLSERWGAMGPAERWQYEKKAAKLADPSVVEYRPDSNFGAVTERVEEMIDDYLQTKEGDRSFDAQEFRVSYKISHF